MIGRGAMFRLLSGIFKIVVVSLLTGVALSALDVSAGDILEGFGLTPEAALRSGAAGHGMGAAQCHPRFADHPSSVVRGLSAAARRAADAGIPRRHLLLLAKEP